ncbi:hypothetical protein E2C01_049233 [Portunus trituberculatus]|uniref:Uncharacterized protein n=1 Tax=Portunus trituberculatus TaxID=210409 RepID=A0A5B7G5M3_PORTR|nr:hypothetical protein [Portunus trituberculatus]
MAVGSLLPTNRMLPRNSPSLRVGLTLASGTEEYRTALSATQVLDETRSNPAVTALRLQQILRRHLSIRSRTTDTKQTKTTEWCHNTQDRHSTPRRSPALHNAAVKKGPQKIL